MTSLTNNNSQKINLLDFSITGLQEWCLSLGEPKFRAVQLMQWNPSGRCD